MPQNITDIMRERDNDSRKKKGEEADAAADSQINQGDLAAAARKAKGIKDSAPSAPGSMGGAPVDPGPDASLGDRAAYIKAKRAYDASKSTSSMSAGSQAAAMRK
jgi:hypothetical protein